MSYLAAMIQNRRVTPQSEPIPGSTQVPNSAGGYSFAVDDWARLQRFIILGSEGGSYYARERDLTKENADAVKRCIAADGRRVVETVSDISYSGRAPKNDPAIFVLALCASDKNPDTRAAALAALPVVCRIGTHLFHFAQFVDGLRGWGRQLRRAVGDWYEYDAGGNQRTQSLLAYQVLKYQQRDGWSHRDLLRLAHPTPHSVTRDVFQWIIKGEYSNASPQIILAYEKAKTADEATLVRLISDHGLTREMIPTEHQKSPKVWEALLEKMPLGAMVRTLGRMGACGLLKPMSDAARTVFDRLNNAELIAKSRIHPIQVLTALLTYRSGHGTKGSLSWVPVQQVIDALDGAFYRAFNNVPSTGKRFYLGLDVSGSMGMGMVAGVHGLTPLIGAAAMAMVAARTESAYYMAGFSDGSNVRGSVRGSCMWGGSVMERLDITAKDRLDRVVNVMKSVPMGGTDCSLPMLDAMHQKLQVDCFVVYTDSETWAGKIHPPQALRQYRDKMGIPTKLVVVGMVSNGFTIADPNDGGCLDVVGFDSATPAVISSFAGGSAATTTEEE